LFSGTKERGLTLVVKGDYKIIMPIRVELRLQDDIQESVIQRGSSANFAELHPEEGSRVVVVSCNSGNERGWVHRQPVQSAIALPSGLLVIDPHALVFEAQLTLREVYERTLYTEQGVGKLLLQLCE
jgi:hypothetical protein